MPGRTPREALNAFVRPIQQALSCVTPAVLVYRPPILEVQVLAVSEDPIRVPLEDGGAVFLSLQQQYEVVEHDNPDLGRWKVSTKAYRYRLDGDDSVELASWHWHPQGRFTHPHLHVAQGRLAGKHLPTSRVSIEGVLRLLLQELEVRARRTDWHEVLEGAEGAFQDYRTWA